MSAKRISVRQTAPNTFAVIDADGRIIRDGFSIPRLAWMWAGKRGLHKGQDRIKRETKIPEEYPDQKIFGLPFYALLSNRPYSRFLTEAKRGEWAEYISRVQPWEVNKYLEAY